MQLLNWLQPLTFSLLFRVYFQSRGTRNASQLLIEKPFSDTEEFSDPGSKNMHIMSLCSYGSVITGHSERLTMFRRYNPYWKILISKIDISYLICYSFNCLISGFQLKG